MTPERVLQVKDSHYYGNTDLKRGKHTSVWTLTFGVYVGNGEPRYSIRPAGSPGAPSSETAPQGHAVLGVPAPQSLPLTGHRVKAKLRTFLLLTPRRRWRVSCQRPPDLVPSSRCFYGILDVLGEQQQMSPLQAQILPFTVLLAHGFSHAHPTRFHPEILQQSVSPLDSDMHQPLL